MIIVIKIINSVGIFERIAMNQDFLFGFLFILGLIPQPHVIRDRESFKCTFLLFPCSVAHTACHTKHSFNASEILSYIVRGQRLE
jgi:hypothetical protein